MFNKLTIPNFTFVPKQAVNILIAGNQKLVKASESIPKINGIIPSSNARNRIENSGKLFTGVQEFDEVVINGKRIKTLPEIIMPSRKGMPLHSLINGGFPTTEELSVLLTKQIRKLTFSATPKSNKTKASEISTVAKKTSRKPHKKEALEVYFDNGTVDSRRANLEEITQEYLVADVQKDAKAARENSEILKLYKDRALAESEIHKQDEAEYINMTIENYSAGLY